MVDVATLGLAVDSSQVGKATDALDKFTGSAGKAQGATDRLRDAKGRFVGAGNAAAAANDNSARAANRASVAYGNLNKAAVAAARAVGLIAGALITNALFKYADAWSDMQSRVGAAVRDMEAAPELMNRIVDIANASYSPLDQTVEIYSRNVAVLRDLGRSATEAADFTEALNHALVLTATRGERAASVQNALSKAMAVGKLQAEGLETILANGGEVAQALADELGTNVNGLRAMASAGKITGDVIANSLITRLDDLSERAGEMPATIEDAFVRIRTNLTAFVGTMDKASGVSEMLAGALISVADGIDWLRGAFVTLMSNLDQVAEAAATAGVALAIAFGPAIIASVQALVVAIGTGMVTAFHALTAAMAANPLGAFAIAVLAAVSAAYYFRDEIQKAIGVDVVGIAKTAANLVIGSFVAAYEDIKFVWGNFGNIMGAAFIGAVNIAIAAINRLVTSAKIALNDIIETVNMIPMVDIGKFDITNDPIGLMRNPYASRLGDAVGERNAAVNSAMTRNWLGDFASAFKTSEQAAADFGSAVAAANQNLENTGGGGGAADKAAKAVKGVADAAKDAAKAALDFGKDLVKGFVSDLRSGLEQGKGFWRSFGDAAMNVLDKIVDKLLNNVIDALFQVNSASGGMGGGGFLGGLFGGIGKLFGFASGGYTGPGAASQPAGIVHAGEYVFSKSAVDRIGLGYLDSLHSAAKGYMAGGYVRIHAPANLNLRGYQSGGYVRDAAPMPAPQVNVEQHYHIEGAVSSKDVQQMVRAGATEAVDTVKRSLSGWQHQIARDGAVA